ncbi:MAG: hypothetical protein ABI318_23085 [Chthoniobacteraceae bacterium]
MNKPKPMLLWGGAVAAVLGALSFPSPTSGQAPGDEDALVQIVNEIAAQHTKIATNQQAIDLKLAAIAENLRLARIMVSRGGGKK